MQTYFEYTNQKDGGNIKKSHTFQFVEYGSRKQTSLKPT